VRWAGVCAGVKGVGEVAPRIWIGSSWPGAPLFHGEQGRLAGQPFTTSFIFGVDYMSTIMDYNSSTSASSSGCWL
jgi:hypothetical protein